MRKPISWDELWMGMAKLVAQRSKDPNTQVGAVLVSPDNKRVAVGYNGFPSGLTETEELWRSPTQEELDQGAITKYDRVVHAEPNALIHANTDTSGWTLYVTYPPCSRCAPVVINAGIKRIVYCFLPNEKSVFKFQHTFNLYKEAGIEVVHFSA